jgi:hypothetical protein
MCSKVNISNSNRQVVNKENSPKPSKLHLYRLEIYKLKKGFALAVADAMILKRLRCGAFKEDQASLGKLVDLSRKGTNKAISKLVGLEIIKRIHGKQISDPRKNGMCTYDFGPACFHLDKLRILVEVLPSLGVMLQAALIVEKEVWNSGQKLSTERLQHTRVINRKLGVTALKSILNNNPYSSYPESSTIIKKECVRVREKVCATNYEKDMTKNRAVETVKNLPTDLPINAKALMWLKIAGREIINGRVERV